MNRLSQTTLDRLGESIELPPYDRALVDVGIVHFGVGNFHRVHQAVYIDRCLRDPQARGWGICGVELIDSEANRAKADAYLAQDRLFTVTEFAPDGSAVTHVIGAMVDYRHAPADAEAVLAIMVSPQTRIISLTITEGGYNIDETTGAFDLTSPAVAQDLAGGAPSTAFGFIVEALRRRRASGTGPFTVMSCDNLRHNGDTARLAVVSFAKALDHELAAWIDTTVTFPNSMVDRIAPQVPAAMRDELNRRSGIEDAVPAMSESFMQWVIEDRFAAGRPSLDTVGVEIRDDVVAFEFMKGRMLNACHMLLSYPGLLCGYRIVHNAMGDDRLRRLLETFLDRDVIPNLEGPQGVSLEAYKSAVLERFANPAVNDQLLRIAHDGAAKIPVFHSKTIEMLLSRDGDLRREAYFLACFERYLRGRDDKGDSFLVNEPRLTPADHALLKSHDPLALLRTSPFEKLGLADHPEFVRLYSAAVAMIDAEGASRALDHLLA
ncbi:mannitol dehydrogenase family protein [Lichenihabitans psoromatis]|uniref:mannitol dehydrogenase family protein n=1 Tax=Lichenihabitans psoromatis TaxID=2528642 RepID=UPI001A93DC5D|nr:mannitol dehydrogenase family protein [Lichenihabitans psoromatis]